MSENDLIIKIQKANSEGEKIWIITNLRFQGMQSDLKEAFLASAVPHWFNPDILAALLSIQKSEAVNLYEIIKKSISTERFGNLGDALDDRTRSGILWNLINHQLNRLQTYSNCAWKYFKQFEDDQNAVEATYHLLITNSSIGIDKFKNQLESYRKQYNYSAANNLTNNGKELIRLGLLPYNLQEFIIGSINLIDEVINQALRRDKVFVSYSHKDKEWLERVQTHLMALNNLGITVNLWDDTQIEAGMKWRDEIEKALSSAKVAILLVSTAFLASEFIRTNELPPLLKAAENDGATILPIILKPCLFKMHKGFAGFQAVNSPEKPLSKLSDNDQEEMLVALAKRIAELLNVGE
jgi:TIR domain